MGLGGQDFAMDQLESAPRHHEWVEIENGSRSLHAFMVFPEVPEKELSVVIIHENRGLTDWVRSFADHLAAGGFLVIVPDLLSEFSDNYSKTSDFRPGMRPEKEFASWKQNRYFLMLMQQEILLQVIRHQKEVVLLWGFAGEVPRLSNTQPISMKLKQLWYLMEAPLIQRMLFLLLTALYMDFMGKMMHE